MTSIFGTSTMNDAFLGPTKTAIADSVRHIFRIFGMCSMSLCALIWGNDDSVLHVQACAISAYIFQSAWFGISFAAALERAKHGKWFAAS